MTGIVPLDARHHAALRFDPAAAGADRRFVRLGLSEIAFAAAEMPLCLAKDAQTGRFNLIALLGLVEPANLFAADGRFRATYIPRAAMLTGFRLHDGGAAGLAIDPADPTIGRDTGDALFVDDAPAPLLARLHDALRRLIADVAAAQALVDLYADRQLIRPLSVRLHLADGRDHDLAGLYTIDDAALRDLPDAAVVALHRADALAPAAILSASLAQVERLRQLHDSRFAPAIAACTLG